MPGVRLARRSAACLGALAVAALLTADPTFAQPGKPAEQAPAPRPVGTATVESAEAALLKKEAYLLPPKEIADAVLAARGVNVSLTDLSPDGRKFLVARRDPLPSLDRLGCPCVHFAELAVDPVAYRARDLWVGSAEALELVFPVEGRTVPVKVPNGARVASPAWSPDGSQLAFLALFPDATHVCVADTETGACRKLTKTPVLATLVKNFQWSLDGKRIQTVLVPDGGKAPAPKLAVATEPKVRVARDGKDPSRTIRYLLDSPFQMQLLEHYITGQLAVIDVADGGATNVGAPAMIRSVGPAPSGGQFRVSTVKKPFSYYASFGAFGTLESVWDAGGKSLVTLSDRNLRETPPQPVDPVAPAPQAFPKGGLTKGAKGGTQPPANPNPDPKVDPNPAPQPPVDPMNPDNPLPVAPAPLDPEGKRDLSWRPDGKGLSFLQLEPAKKDEPKKEAKDGAKKDDAKVVRKDRVLLWLPPFAKTDEKVVYETETRILGVQYSADCRWMFISQTIDNQRQISAIDLTDATAKPYVVSRSFGGFSPKKDDMPPKKDDSKDDDDSGDEQPGGFRGPTVGIGLMTRTFGASNVVRVSSTGDVYTTGTDRARGAGGKGAPDAKEESFGKPYIDSVSIKTGKRTRVFEGKSDMLETIDAVNGDDITRVFTTRQKSNVVPDSYMTDLASGRSKKLTNNVDKTPWFHELKTERFRVTRADGFKFWVKVTRSPKAEGKLPALFWIYPREYADQAAYDQGAGRAGPTSGTGGRYTAPTPRSVAILTLAGYAVVEPDVPIVGPTGRMNDNYVADLRNSLWAAIDECDKRGLIDRDRLACGGHSYGAFSTANALAHTPFFKAGIAGDGCYNRTLTSMSFQSERRHLWDARETYLEMSPLLRANQINGALLMYHGMEDENVGTHPMNSEALFAALDGLGKNAALYMYPYEGHGPIARETNMDMWARWIAWLDLYVKNPKKADKK